MKRLVTGGEVTYGDIREGYAFPRSAAKQIAQQITSDNEASVHILLGPSGSGKTSAARLAISELASRGIACYEHKANIGVDLPTWRDVDAQHLRERQRACLFLDEPNASQFAVNQLTAYLLDGAEHSLSLIISYHPSIWSYRTKSAALVKESRIHDLRRLTPSDAQAIATHVKRSPDIAKLLATDVQGKTHQEIVKTVQNRARADLFVCLKYLFETKSLDEIVLREFDHLGRDAPPGIRTNVRSLYATVAFLEACGSHVHRQMVMRLTDVASEEIGLLLDYLDGVILESERDEHIEGIYQWNTRHPRIASIVARSKFSRGDRRALIERTIRSINPASRVERQFAARLCTSDLGIESWPLDDQTYLYGLLSEALPGERVPRHRLIRNLTRQKRFGEAEMAISEAREMHINDAVIHRYDVALDVAKAENLDFLDQNDRLNLLGSAVSKAAKSLSRRPDDMFSYESLCKASYALSGGPLSQLEDAVRTLRAGYKDIGDELMVEWITRYESELTRLQLKDSSES